MTKTIKVALLTGALFVLAGRVSAQEPTPRDSAPAAAGPAVSESDHKAEAVKHITAAIDAGKSGSAKGVTGHAQEALTHAEALAKQQPGDDVNAAVKDLEDAVTKGKSGDADGATRSAEEALEKLQPR